MADGIPRHTYPVSEHIFYFFTQNPMNYKHKQFSKYMIPFWWFIFELKYHTLKQVWNCRYFHSLGLQCCVHWTTRVCGTWGLKSGKISISASKPTSEYGTTRKASIQRLNPRWMHYIVARRSNSRKIWFVVAVVRVIYFLWFFFF